MPRLSFSLRDVFWLTLVVGMGVGWVISAKRLSDENARLEYRAISAEGDFKRMTKSLDEFGIEWWPGKGQYWFSVPRKSRAVSDLPSGPRDPPTDPFGDSTAIPAGDDPFK